MTRIRQTIDGFQGIGFGVLIFADAPTVSKQDVQHSICSYLSIGLFLDSDATRGQGAVNGGIPKDQTHSGDTID
jgi:hypothetical protein